MSIKRLGPIEGTERENVINFGNLTIFYGLPDVGKSYVLKRAFAEYMFLNEISVIFGDGEINDALKWIVTSRASMEIYRKINAELARGNEIAEVEIDLYEKIISPLIREWGERYAEYGRVNFSPSLEEVMKKVKLAMDERSNDLEFSARGTTVKFKLKTNLRFGELFELVTPYLFKVFDSIREYLRSEIDLKGVRYLVYGRCALNLYVRALFRFVTSSSRLLKDNSFLGNVGMKADTDKLRELYLEKLVEILTLHPVDLLSPEWIVVSELKRAEGSRLKLCEASFRDGRYARGGIEVPLERASAYANELYALLALSRDAESEWLLIEEPETQLHPREQVAVAAYLYKLAQRNRVVVTTHSPTVIATLVFLHEGIRRGRDPCKLIRCRELCELELLKDFKIYHFRRRDEDGKTEIVERDVKELFEKGIDTISEVASELARWYSGYEVVLGE